MRNILMLVVAVALSMPWLTSCKVDADVPVVETLPIDSSNFEYVYLGGNVLDDGGDAVTLRGVCVSIDSTIAPTVNSTEGDVYWTYDSTGTGMYNSRVKAKWTGNYQNIRHRHFIRAYASNGAGTGYGQTVVYTPTAKPLTSNVVTLQTPIVDSVNVIIRYNLVPNGCFIQDFILCYDSVSNPTINSAQIAIANPQNEDPIMLQNLELSTTYYFRIYMNNENNEEIYSEEVSCTTSQGE